MPGFRRFLSTMCFFVVRVSQMGSVSAGVSSAELSSSLTVGARRFLVVEAASLRVASVWMCLRRAVEALSVCML